MVANLGAGLGVDGDGDRGALLALLGSQEAGGAVGGTREWGRGRGRGRRRRPW